MTEERSSVAFIGYPKAASTLLFDYFQAHPDVLARMVLLTPLTGTTANPADGGIESSAESGRLKILTNEKIAESVLVTGDSRVWNANRFIPGAWEKVQNCVRIDPLETARRVRQGYGVGRVLIVVRDQLEWLQSAYKYFLPRLPPRRRSFADFCATPRGMAYLQAGYFDRTIEAYQEVFGRQNVKVMRTEDLARDPEAFQTELCDFLGIGRMPIPKERKNVGSSNQVATIRARYPFLDALPVGVKAMGKIILTKLLPTQRSVISPEEAASIRCRYAESNERTAILLREMKAAQA